jgi:hypothetical protein
MFQPGDDPFNTITPDPIATADADNVKVWIKRHLGDDILSVELTDKQIYANFEQAIHKFSALVNEYYGESNLADFLGTSTGTLDNVTGQLPSPNLGWELMNAAAYAAESGVGGNLQTYIGNFSTADGQQYYDLPTVLSESWQRAYGNEVTGKIRIIQLYHLDPWDQFGASNALDWGGGAFGYFAGMGAVPAGGAGGGYNAQYQIMPVFDSILRRTMFKQAKQVRMSHYSYNVIGNELVLYPCPRSSHFLWLRWRKSQDPMVFGTSGTLGGGAFGETSMANLIPGSVSSIANMPLGLMQYGKVNQIGKQWIWFYTLALSKQTLGYVRRKINSGIPYPGGTSLTLDGEAMVTEGKADMERYETELRTKLENLTYEKLAEREAAKAESLNKTLKYVPLGIYVK